jgi:prepilin-type N-terminal cleavage/methylation domain-containing protein/prepilin-type processing-associated H-X9-DG protein
MSPSRDRGVSGRAIGAGRWRAPPQGFTVVELLVVVSIIGILVGLLMPAVQAARESGRRTQCANNVRQLGLAAHSYHAAQRSFPPARQDAANTWGHFAKLLPFLEQKVIYRNIDFTKAVYDPSNAEIAQTPMPVFRCPSDYSVMIKSSDPLAFGGWAKNNYRGNAGNDTGEIGPDGAEKNNGVFRTGRRISVEQIEDGTSNTALFSEGVLGDGSNFVISVPGDWLVISPGSRRRQNIYAALQSAVPSAGPGNQVSYAGRTYLDGGYVESRYNHIMRPNGPSGVVPNGEDLFARINDGAQATTASSRHPGGVNLVLADGSVRFVSEGVDLEVWWGLGSIAGGEMLSTDF